MRGGVGKKAVRRCLLSYATTFGRWQRCRFVTKACASRWRHSVVWVDNVCHLFGASVVVNASPRSSCCCRTMNEEGTACFVLQFVMKLQTYPAPAVAAGLRPALSKRQRASDADSFLVWQLMYVPSVGNASRKTWSSVSIGDATDGLA